jgi:flavin reductase (DIM6/NTAB) family NADH-FMN oxidoreductase RutF
LAFKEIEMQIDPKSIKTADFHSHMLAAIAPRPIAFASTIDEAGNVNLSPYSFFNCFGSNPPILIFSPARRVRDNTTKHSLQNVQSTREVVINVVSYAMVQQMSLSSCEYDKGVNEFIKAGFTEAPSVKVKPPRVAEAPVAFECAVKEIIETGTEGGAGNLVICEIVMMHVREEVLNAEGKIDQQKIDLVGRLGADWYVRASGDALFEVAKPNRNLGIGVDQLPVTIRLSKLLTGNDLGKLANLDHIPNRLTDEEKMKDKQLLTILQKGQAERAILLHQYAQQLLKREQVIQAFQVLLEE